jgi:hypothetical protein
MLALSIVAIVLAAVAFVVIALSWVSLIRIKRRVARLERKKPSQEAGSLGY